MVVGCSSKRKSKPKAGKRTKKNRIIDDMPEKINVIDYLSEDNWFEIFTHLPLKLIFRMKLLSKQWYFLISSPNFMTRKLNLCTFYFKFRPVNQPLIRYQSIPIVFTLNTDPSDYFTADQEYIHYGLSLKFLPKSTQNRLCILGSSNGLLLCRFIPCEGGVCFYYIYNPLSRLSVFLRGSSDYDNDEQDTHVLVFESSSSTLNSNPTDFKVIRIPEITIPRKKFYLKIYSSDEGQWRNYKVLFSHKITMLYQNKNKVVRDQDGRLYWIIESNKIVTYDLKNNIGGIGECMLIELPKNEEENGHGSDSAARSCLAESEGYIFYIRIEIRQMNVSVWLLEEEKDDEQWSWKVVHKIKVNEMLAGYDWNDTRITNMKPLGFSPMNKNIVFWQSDEYILQYKILTRRLQMLSLSSHLHGPISSYEFGVLPFLATTKPTTLKYNSLYGIVGIDVI